RRVLGRKTAEPAVEKSLVGGPPSTDTGCVFGRQWTCAPARDAASDALAAFCWTTPCSRSHGQGDRAQPPRSGGIRAGPVVPWNEGVGSGQRYREVVQRGERLRLHLPGRGRGRVRPLLRDPSRWLQDLGRRRQGGVRRHPRPQGAAGVERPKGLASRPTAAAWAAAQPPPGRRCIRTAPAPRPSNL